MGRSRDKGRGSKARGNYAKSAKRPHKYHSGNRPSQTSEGPVELPAVQSRELQKLLAGIGTPPPSPFKPDPFQLEALAALEFEDVLVTAPTGSGKTWIAQEEIRRLLEAKRRAWYT